MTKFSSVIKHMAFLFLPPSIWHFCCCHQAYDNSVAACSRCQFSFCIKHMTVTFSKYLVCISKYVVLWRNEITEDSKQAFSFTASTEILRIIFQKFIFAYSCLNVCQFVIALSWQWCLFFMDTTVTFDTQWPVFFY